MNISAYAKSIIMTIGAGVAVFVAALTDGHITPVEYINIAIAIAGAVLVYIVPNESAGAGKYTKAIIGIATAALTAAATALSGVFNFGDVTASTWSAVGLGVVAAILTYIVPNTAIPVVASVSATPAQVTFAKAAYKG